MKTFAVRLFNIRLNTHWKERFGMICFLSDRDDLFLSQCSKKTESHVWGKHEWQGIHTTNLLNPGKFSKSHKGTFCVDTSS